MLPVALMCLGVFGDRQGSVKSLTDVQSSLRLMIAITVFNRREYTQYSAAVLRSQYGVRDDDIYVFDDGSTVFSRMDLKQWYGEGCTVITGGHKGPDKLIRHSVEYMLSKTSYDAILLLDSDLILQPTWYAYVQRNLPRTDGVLSLYNSRAHKTISCSNSLCVKDAIGSAGIVMRRDVISHMLSHNRNPLFDWGFSSYFQSAHIRLLVPERSMACHFGVVGEHSKAGMLYDRAVSFDMETLPKWVQVYARHVLQGAGNSQYKHY